MPEGWHLAADDDQVIMFNTEKDIQSVWSRKTWEEAVNNNQIKLMIAAVLKCDHKKWETISDFSATDLKEFTGDKAEVEFTSEEEYIIGSIHPYIPDNVEVTLNGKNIRDSRAHPAHKLKEWTRIAEGIYRKLPTGFYAKADDGFVMIYVTSHPHLFAQYSRLCWDQLDENAQNVILQMTTDMLSLRVSSENLTKL